MRDGARLGERERARCRNMQRGSSMEVAMMLGHPSMVSRGERIASVHSKSSPMYDVG
jgi:hypothetical protein